VTSCGFCGRENDTESRFCFDCGKPMHPSAARGICPQCAGTFTTGVDLFCSRCGHRVGQRVSIQAGTVVGTPAAAGARAGASRAGGPLARLALLDDAGEVLQTYVLERGEAVIGRVDADMKFESDQLMSPVHARIELRNGQLLLRDLGSRNGTWVFIEAPTKLTDADLILLGSQLLRFRRLGYPGPHPPEADSTRRMGSAVPTVDVAVLEQLRADGSVRDVFHLSPGRTVRIGRESGDWLFSYDATMSGRHAEIRNEDSDFFVHDTDSRNGVATAVRGERALRPGQRLLIGDQLLRVEPA
jgi:pSer/pThr/pTyr-binding forkhead associated (FHA) protein